MSAADPLGILPPPTRRTWGLIAPILPAAAYLMDGTALAVRLGHRQSLDLDFFLESPVDLAALAEQLGQLAPTALQLLTDDTLNCLFADTRLQFLEATTQRMIAAPEVIAGIRVGALPDLMATKLAATGSRGDGGHERPPCPCAPIQLRPHDTQGSVTLVCRGPVAEPCPPTARRDRGRSRGWGERRLTGPELSYRVCQTARKGRQGHSLFVASPSTPVDVVAGGHVGASGGRPPRLQPPAAPANRDR